MQKQQNLFHKNFTIIAVGQLISLLGNGLQRYALSLYILDLTGSATIFSTLLSLTILPQIFLAPFGGAIADRISKKNIMVFLDFLAGGLLLLFALFLPSVSSKVVLIGILMTTLAIIQSVYDPTVRASIPLVVAPEALTSANSITNQISAISALLSPIVAGFLYGFLGIRMIFLLNMLSFFFSAIMELFLSIPTFEHNDTTPNLSVVLSDIKGSFRYLKNERRLILYMLLVAASVNLFLTPLYTVGLPYIEKMVFHISDGLYGISEGCIGIGMIVGSILTALVAKKIPFEKLHHYFYMIAGVVVLFGLPTIPTLLSSRTLYGNFIVFTCMGFFFSVLIAIINIMCITFTQLNTPKEQLGKTMALVTALSSALMPIGQVLFGSIFQALGHWIILIFFFSAGITAAIAILIRYLMKRTYNETEYTPLVFQQQE